MRRERESLEYAVVGGGGSNGAWGRAELSFQFRERGTGGVVATYVMRLSLLSVKLCWVEVWFLMSHHYCSICLESHEMVYTNYPVQ
jgi:hypothetical protein